ncbi:peptide/nickel transport system permease protein [Pacificibacter maritimus]|uniref:Peptide/nickel transport system permease protein n=1 Tax=Pacificibacter maritimus TaxID=762213 RepID=A0A3N4V149_9RHOB|nr:ABC transporter permease [Pacificibacter maritimus]RPE66634.1 peptide/nickel transport system permease protein [Pacificibacter maritimus]
MGAYFVRKLIEAAAVCVAVSIIAFLLVQSTGDLAVAMGGLDASAEDTARLREVYGLDQSFVQQYLSWAGRVLHGDLGQSYFSQEDVLTLILERLPVTATLSVASLLLGLLISIPAGVYCAMKPDGWFDRSCLGLSVLGQAMPSYWVGLLLILLFGVTFRILPISGTQSAASYVMPSLTLAWFVFPVFLRLSRAGMIDVLSSDYIRTARAKGLSERTVLFKHALRNAILPVVSVATVQFGFLLGGSIVVESVFSLNGIGLLAWSAIQRSDYPVVQAVVLIVAIIFVLLNVVSDLLNAALDPRLTSEQ